MTAVALCRNTSRSTSRCRWHARPWNTLSISRMTTHPHRASASVQACGCHVSRISVPRTSMSLTLYCIPSPTQFIMVRARCLTPKSTPSPAWQPCIRWMSILLSRHRIRARCNMPKWLRRRQEVCPSMCGSPSAQTSNRKNATSLQWVISATS